MIFQPQHPEVSFMTLDHLPLKLIFVAETASDLRALGNGNVTAIR